MLNSDLIRAAKKSSASFAELYNLYSLPVYRYIFNYLRNKEDTDDVVSDIWEISFKSIGTLRSNHPQVFKCWLFKVARNSLYQHFRSKQRRILSIDEDAFISLELEPLEYARQRGYLDEARMLIDILPETQRKIIVMRFYSGLRNREIAHFLKVKEKTISSNLSRALTTLRKNFLQEERENMKLKT